jgi:hypothetical protein
MDITPQTNEQWARENEPAFTAAHSLANDIEVQNTLYSELVESGTLTLKQFQDTAAEYLINEQVSTFDKLKTFSEEAPYEELAISDLIISADLAAAALKLSNIEAEIEKETAILDEEQALVSTRIPELAPKLSEIALQIRQRMITNAKDEVEADIARLKAEYDSLVSLYTIAGKPWPLPRLLPSVETEEIDNDTHTGPVDIIEVDSFPGKNIEYTKAVVDEKLSRRHPESVERDASEFIALFLAESLKTAYTREELANVLYGEGAVNGAQRISALISNYRLGKVSIIGNTLSDEGLVLQYGERIKYNRENGRTFGQSKTIFRAVPISEIDKKEGILHADLNMVDTTWNTITPSFSAEDPLIPDSITTETIELSQSIIVAEADDDITEFTQPENIIEQVHPESEEVQLDWTERLLSDVEAAIQHFENDGIMIDGVVTRRLMNTKSSSYIMGTDEMISRGVRNGIVKKSETSPEEPLAIHKFISMSVQNKYADIFGNRSRRKKALIIIEDAVRKHFESAADK